jgi:hypothetical protein
MTKKTLFVIGVCVVVAAVAAIVLYQKAPLTRQATQTPTSTQYTVQNTTTTNALPHIASTSTTADTATDHKGMKLYRNEEFGFEFWYPENWEIMENSFKSPYSKFNFEVIKIDGKYTNLFDGMNLVTKDFYDNFLVNSETDNSEVTDITLGSVFGKQFHYTNEYGLLKTDITFPIGKHFAIFFVERKREKELHQILSTFKFLK